MTPDANNDDGGSFNDLSRQQNLGLGVSIRPQEQSASAWHALSQGRQFELTWPFTLQPNPSADQGQDEGKQESQAK